MRPLFVEKEACSSPLLGHHWSKLLHASSDWRAPPPKPIFAVGIRLFAAFDRIRAALAPPPLTLFELFLGFMRSQARTACCLLLYLLPAALSRSVCMRWLYILLVLE